MPEQTASSGVPPGAAMSTPLSSDQVLGGETSPLGMGNVKLPLLERRMGPLGEFPDPPPP